MDSEPLEPGREVVEAPRRARPGVPADDPGRPSMIQEYVRQMGVLGVRR